jgi:hypothetical protein
MVSMPSVDAEIDELYKAPLQQFVQLRTALAKRLTGADAQRVKALPKPTVVPWAVNQLYWSARPLYERLTKSGARLRAAQIAGLEGRAADVRQATEAHRQALAEAVKQASSLASRAGAHPDADALTQTLEALSLTSNVEAPGRLTKPLQPAGFEALAGVDVRPAPPSKSVSPVPPKGHTRSSEPTAEERRRARLEAAAERRQAETIREAENALKKAQAAEARAREAWERTRDEVEKAERELAHARTKSMHVGRS